jgi:hypothetical protein
MQDLQACPANYHKTDWCTFSSTYLSSRRKVVFGTVSPNRSVVVPMRHAAASTTRTVKKTSTFLTGLLAMLVAAGLLSSAGTAQAALIPVAGTITVDADYGDSFKLGDTSLPSPNPAPGPPQRCSSAVQVSCAGASNSHFPAFRSGPMAVSAASHQPIPSSANS